MPSANHDTRFDATWDRRFAVLLTGLFLLRLGYLLVAPLDLAPDEAYYWDWSRHLDWGYLSKPPMVAWMIGGSTWLLGSSPFGVRFPAVLLGTLGLWCLYGLGRRLYGPRVGFWAVVLSAATPGNCALNLIMTIDAPLMLFWSFSLYGLWRSVEDSGRHPFWWMMTAFAVGLGLLSKQSMLGFPALLPVFLWASRKDRHLLRGPWPYLFVLFSLMFLIPVVWWNFRHDWATLHHTAHHFEHVKGGVGLSLLPFLKLLGTQLGVLSPLTWILMIVVGVAGLRHLCRRDRREVFLLVFGVLPLLGIFLLSLRQKVHGNWPGPVYSALAVLLAAWAVGALPQGPRLSGWRSLFRPAWVTGALLSILAYVLPFLLLATPLSGSRLDPTVRVRGWRELGTRIGTMKEAILPGDRGFIASPRRQVVSELAFYIPGQPQVFRWPPHKGSSPTQYEIWPPPSGGSDAEALLVIEAKRGLPKNVHSSFEQVRPVGEVSVPLGPEKNRLFKVYRGSGLLRWPSIK